MPAFPAASHFPHALTCIYGCIKASGQRCLGHRDVKEGKGVGRPRLSVEVGTFHHQARQILGLGIHLDFVPQDAFPITRGWCIVPLVFQRLGENGGPTLDGRPQPCNHLQSRPSPGQFDGLGFTLAQIGAADGI